MFNLLLCTIYAAYLENSVFYVDTPPKEMTTYCMVILQNIITNNGNYVQQLVLGQTTNVAKLGNP